MDAPIKAAAYAYALATNPAWVCVQQEADTGLQGIIVEQKDEHKKEQGGRSTAREMSRAARREADASLVVPFRIKDERRQERSGSHEPRRGNWS